MSVSRQEFYQQFFDLMAASQPFVCVTLVYTSGSVPQDQGAKMLVTESGLYAGTVGGGKVEQKALSEAKALLTKVKQTPEKTQIYREWNLNHDVGMTCGGNVKFYFELMNVQRWQIVVFGAGHVAQLLVPLLTTLDAQITCIDTRQDWLDKLPEQVNLTKICVEKHEDYVDQIASQSFVVLMTMGHTSDKPILLDLLSRQETSECKYPYIGVIGSQAKAVQLKKDIEEAGLPEECQTKFFCPVGLDIGNNQPAEIAISVAAQLLSERDRLAGTNTQNSEQESERELQWAK